MSAGTDLLEQLETHLTKNEREQLEFASEDFIDGFFIGRFSDYAPVTMYNVAACYREKYQ
jgi:hypothetical protein